MEALSYHGTDRRCLECQRTIRANKPLRVFRGIDMRPQARPPVFSSPYEFYCVCQKCAGQIDDLKKRGGAYRAGRLKTALCELRGTGHYILRAKGMARYGKKHCNNCKHSHNGLCHYFGEASSAFQEATVVSCFAGGYVCGFWEKE